MATETIEFVLDNITARAILSEVAAGGWFDTEIPENEEDLINLAESYVEEAKQWIEGGNPEEEHVNAIINLAKGVPTSPPVLSQSAELNQIEETAPGEIDSVIKESITQEYEDRITKEALVRETYPRRSSGGYSESDFRVPDELPVPKPNPETTYDMPTDLTEVGDKSLRRLYSAFNAYSGRARWMLAISTSNLANANHLLDAEYRKMYSFYARDLAIKGERATKDTLESFAKESEEYKEWEEKVLKHEKEVIHWRALSDIYGKNVEVLSREWSMRTEQYERER